MRVAARSRRSIDTEKALIALAIRAFSVFREQ